MVGSGSEQPNVVILAILIPPRWHGQQRQANPSSYLMTSFSSIEFLLIFIWLSVWCFIFCCNVYNTFLYVLPSKANVKNAKNAPLTCIAGLLCMLDADVSHNTSVCVEFFDSCVTVHNCWAFSHSCVSLLESKSYPPRSTSIPYPTMASAWRGCSHGLKVNSWPRRT